MKKLLIAVRTAPYGSAAIPESVRAAMGLSTMPFETRYLLMDDAVWALLPDQQPAGIAASSVLDTVSSLTDLDVELCVEAEALQERGIDEATLTVPVTPVSREDIADLIGTADAVLTY
jgi:tRNA 2-thiouridine synthesizing protein C